MFSIRRALSAGSVALVVAGLSALPTEASTRPLTPVVAHTASTTIKMELPKPFVPVAPKGGHDLYHCALLNPKVTVDQMITSVTFMPGTFFEVHHAILYWVPPALAAEARAADHNGKGWTCFGGTGIGGGGSVADLGSTAWLGAWSPGHGPTVEPAGTGMPLPAGSLIIMQVHYNLLGGAKPDQSKVTLTTVPEATSGLIPLHIDLYPAPMDLPCPAGTSGTLCSRSASLADIGKRFGQSAVNFDNLLEQVCHGGTPVVGDTASCTWQFGSNAYIWTITPHMHLLGVGFKVTLNPGTPAQRVLLSVPSYNFHYQRSYDMANPVYVKSTDHIQVSCTYNPVLRTTTPLIDQLPPRYVLWADGSSDEMCLGVIGVTSVLPSGVTPSTVHALPSAPSWPNALALTALRSPASFLGSKDFTTPSGRRNRAATLRIPVCV